MPTASAEAPESVAESWIVSPTLITPSESESVVVIEGAAWMIVSGSQALQSESLWLASLPATYLAWKE